MNEGNTVRPEIGSMWEDQIGLARDGNVWRVAGHEEENGELYVLIDLVPDFLAGRVADLLGWRAENHQRAPLGVFFEDMTPVGPT